MCIARTVSAGEPVMYGVIGNPIGHSLSPQLQNAGFRARRIDAVYLPFLVRDLNDFAFDRTAANERIQRYSAAQGNDSSLSR